MNNELAKKIARAIDDNCYEEGERWRACLPKMASACLALIDWQPIETAPEQTDVIIYIPKAKRRPVRLGRYGIKADGNRLWTYGGEFAFDVGIATRWMPLPDPPKD